ncbi:MAG: hypothetical protein AAF500_04530 [Myxococcota bacterium]
MFRRIIPLLAVAVLAVVLYSVVRQLRAPPPAAPLDVWRSPPTSPPSEAPVPPEPDPGVQAFFDAVAEAGAQVFHVGKPRPEVRTVHVRVPIPEESIQSDGNTEYADIDLGGRMVRVVKRRGAPGGPIANPSRRPILAIPGEDDRGLALFVVVRTFTQDLTAAEPQLAEQVVSVFELGNEGSGPLITNEQLATPGNGVDCPAEAAASGLDLTGLAVVVPPVKVRNCNDDQTTMVCSSWVRAYWDVGIVLGMLEHMFTQPQAERVLLWNQTWGDEEGDAVAETSLGFWFGDYTEYRFEGILQVFRKLRQRMRDPGLWSLSEARWSMTCTGCPPGWRASHRYRGDLRICFPSFAGLSEDLERPSTMTHEALHYNWVPFGLRWRRIDDFHTHKHGFQCSERFGNVNSYGPCRARHLAVYPTYDEECGPWGGSSPGSSCQGCGSCLLNDDCGHRDLAARNNDNYALATASIGKGLRTDESQYWPLLAEGLTPPGAPNCTVEGLPSAAALFQDPLEACVWNGETSAIDCSTNATSLAAGYYIVCN